MAASAEQETALKQEGNENLDKDALNTFSPTPVKIKKEEPDDEKEVLERLDRENRDMFEDVDEDVEYVDLTYEGFAEINGVEHFVCEQFRIPRIQEPTVIRRHLQHLFDQIESGNLVLDPAYQREVVWDEGRASLLITSVLMNYFIPPVLFNLKSKIRVVNGRKESYVERTCVDGKQRLTSVWKFMKGHIGFFDTSHPPKKWYYCHPVINGVETVSNHNLLPVAVKKLFRESVFCCYEYQELTLHVEETMFQLVQRGVALTAAEKMRALSTDWALFTKQYEDDYSLVINLSKQNRGSGFRLILTIFTMIQEVLAGRKKKSSAPTLQASPAALGRVLDEKEKVTPVLKLRFKAIFDRYEKLVKLSSTLLHSKYELNRNSAFDPHADFLQNDATVSHVQSFSPLELVGTAILIAMHMDKRSDDELIEDIKGMRHYIRVKHKDLRVNAQCWATTWGFISTELPPRWSSQNDTPEASDVNNDNTADVKNGKADGSSVSTTQSKSTGDAEGGGGRLSTVLLTRPNLESEVAKSPNKTRSAAGVGGGGNLVSTAPSKHSGDGKRGYAAIPANRQQRAKHDAPLQSKSKLGNDRKDGGSTPQKGLKLVSGAMNGAAGTPEHTDSMVGGSSPSSARGSKRTSNTEDRGTRAPKKLKTASDTGGGLGESSKKSRRGNGMGGGTASSPPKKSKH